MLEKIHEDHALREISKMYSSIAAVNLQNIG